MNKRYTYSVTCPVSYYNGTRWSLSWRNGRSLTAASSGSTGISFTYDAGGMRTSKTVGTVSSIYFYASGKLLREVRYNSADQTTAVLDFFYAYDGTPYAMKYNGTVYYFVTNLQGDVVMILNADGSLAGGYAYDPYGKVLSATGTIATINPLRYRGYYHDAETGFYYLQSRYYDPEIGRFINADGYASTGQGIIGHNMFAYCNNNPVNYVDVSGGFPWLVVGGAVVSVGTSYVAAAIEGEPYSWMDAGVAATSGALGMGGKAAIAVGIALDAGYSMYKASKSGASKNDIMLEGVSSVVSSSLSPSSFLSLGSKVRLSPNVTDTFDMVFSVPADMLSAVANTTVNSLSQSGTMTQAEYKKLTFMERRLDPPKKTSNISQAEYKKLTFMERRLNPPKKISNISHAEYKKLTFMERRLSK